VDANPHPTAAASTARRNPAASVSGPANVARYASIWHAFGGPDTQARKAAVLAEHCAAIGRDPDLIERSTAIPAGGVSDADALVDLGVTLFTIGLSGPEYDMSSVPSWLEWRDRHNSNRG